MVEIIDETNENFIENVLDVQNLSFKVNHLLYHISKIENMITSNDEEVRKAFYRLKDQIIVEILKKHSK